MMNLGHIGRGGTIATQGIGAVITGTAVRISMLVGIGVPANGEELIDVKGTAGGYGSLDFVTGVVRSVKHLGYGLWEYVYDGGGLITVRGNVAAAGISGNQVLLSGSLYDGRFYVQDTGAGYLVFMQAAGTDSTHTSLVNYFGLPNTSFTFAGFSIAAALIGNVGATGAFSAIAHTTDVTNTVVAEPATAMLIGTGMIALSACLRRRAQRHSAPMT